MKGDSAMSDRNLRKTRVGIVSSDKMDKTIVVSVVEHVKHPENKCGIGDKVKVMETRPLSKDKRWRLVEIIEKAK